MNNELQIISLLLQKMKFQDLTKDEYQHLQHLLLKNERTLRKNYPLTRTRITGDKIMYISDTHIGESEENKRLTDIAYNKASQKGIKTVIHLGDLIEGRANNNFDKKPEVIQKELETALACMPEEIKTKLLLGNHDYSVMGVYPAFIEELFKCKKLEILGLQKVIVNWDDMLSLSLYHQIKQINQLGFNQDSGLLKLWAHYHNYSFNPVNLVIKLPCLCEDSLDMSLDYLASVGITYGGYDKPLFVIASKESEESILFQLYSKERGNTQTCKSVETILFNAKTKQLKK